VTVKHQQSQSVCPSTNRIATQLQHTLVSIDQPLNNSNSGTALFLKQECQRVGGYIFIRSTGNGAAHHHQPQSINHSPNNWVKYITTNDRTNTTTPIPIPAGQHRQRQSINHQSINQSTSNQRINHHHNQSTEQPTNQPINEPINERIKPLNKRIHQPTDQRTNPTNCGQGGSGWVGSEKNLFVFFLRDAHTRHTHTHTTTYTHTHTPRPRL